MSRAIVGLAINNYGEQRSHEPMYKTDTKKTNIAIAILEKLRIVLIFLNPIRNY